jgi:peptide/nickel transport system ATP-binding protein
LSDPRQSVLLSVEHLTTAFATSRGPLRAVDDVSFTLRPGETFGIVGESGSGKSALVRTIMGLQPRSAIVPPESRLVFDGADVRSLSREQKRHFWGPQIAMIFQDPMTSLNPVRTIGSQMIAPIRYHLGLSRSEAQSRAAGLLAQVGISAPDRRLKQYPHELSGGMRQRVMIAIALSCDPKLLIADEPTTALDVTVQKQILDLLARLQQERHMAVILISHDLGVVAGRTARTAVMYAGRIVETAPTADLFDAMRHPYTQALLLSVPRLEQPSHTRLEAIAGRPPDLVAIPPGCRFSPRCPYVQPRCREEEPPLDAAGTARHPARCWYPVGTGAGREALERNLAAHVAQAEAVVGGDADLLARLELVENDKKSEAAT